MKFCKDCKHYERPDAYGSWVPRCWHPLHLNPVNGGGADPFFLRIQGHACGMDAQLFEEKPTPTPAPWWKFWAA